VTGWLALAGIVLTFLTALLGFIVSLRNARKLEGNARRLEDVHVLVDGNLSAVMLRLGIETARSDQLATDLADAGLPVTPREKTLKRPGDPPPVR
jgi:uncharacterized membrane protein